MEILGFKIPDVTSNLLRLASRYPSGVLIISTIAATTLMHLRSTAASSRLLVASQQECLFITEKAVVDCKGLWKEFDAVWNEDLMKRDALIRQLQLQNVEQTRSVDRLQDALRTCAPVLQRGGETSAVAPPARTTSTDTS